MSDQITSHDIFSEFCVVKPALALEFISDYLLYELDICNNFNDVKYKNVYKFIFDFMIGCDPVIKFYLKYIESPKEDFNLEKFTQLFSKLQFKEESNKFFFGVFLANSDKLMMIKNKTNSLFDKDEMKNYQINIQTEFGDSCLSSLDNEFKVLINFNKNAPNQGYENMFEVDEKELDNFIFKLKDIYCSIKS